MCEEKTKVCSRCGNVFPVTSDYFFRDRRTKDGFLASCKTCKSKAEKDCHNRNREEWLARKRELSRGNKGQISEQQRIYRETHKEELRAKKKKYYDEHREEILAQKRIYTQKTKEHKHLYNKDYVEKNKEKLNKLAKERYERDREKQLAQRKEYYKDHREEIITRVAEYRKNNKKKIYECNKRYYQTDIGRESNRRAGQIRKAREKDLRATFTLEQWNCCKEYFSHACAYCGKESSRLSQDHFVPVVKGGTYTVDNILPVCKKCNSSKQGFDFNDWYLKQPFFSKGRLKKIYKYLNYDGSSLQMKLDL